MSEVKRCTGVVIWFSGKSGLGFIAPDSGGKDLFVHWRHIIDMDGFKVLKQGQVVEYGLGENDKGPMAVEVKIIKDAPDQE